MANPQVLLASLNFGRCSDAVEVRLLRFWEARNIRRGGELMSLDMLFVDADVSELALIFCSLFHIFVFLNISVSYLPLRYDSRHLCKDLLLRTVNSGFVNVSLKGLCTRLMVLMSHGIAQISGCLTLPCQFGSMMEPRLRRWLSLLGPYLWKFSGSCHIVVWWSWRTLGNNCLVCVSGPNIFLIFWLSCVSLWCLIFIRRAWWAECYQKHHHWPYTRGTACDVNSASWKVYSLSWTTNALIAILHIQLTRICFFPPAVRTFVWACLTQKLLSFMPSSTAMGRSLELLLRPAWTLK